MFAYYNVPLDSKDSESLFEKLDSKPKVPLYLKEVEKELIGRIRTQFDYKSGENPYVKFTKIEIPFDETVVSSGDADSIREFHRFLLILRKKALQMKLDDLIFVLDQNDGTVHYDKKVVLMNRRLFSCPSVVLLNYNEESYKNALPSKGTTQSICSRLIEKSMMVEGSKYVLAIFSSEILHYLHYIKIFEVHYNSVRMIIVNNDCTVSSIWKTPMVACKGSKFSSIKATRMNGFLPAAKTTVVKKYCIYFERALVKDDYVVGTKPDFLGREESDAETFSREDPDRLTRGATITAAVKPVEVQKEEIVGADVVEPDRLSDEATATGADVEVQKEEIVGADVVDLENVNTVSPPPPSIAVLAEAIAALEIDELSKFEQDQFERYNRGIDLMNMAFVTKRAIEKAREYAQ
uniref:Uncharacterized protein n=1 Tax=Panagrolaimus sp. ES5 TaxID=591445 RepID=A0AC34GR34_9BILA